MSVAPYSTMPVDVVSGLFGKDLSRVGLKLARGVKSLLIDVIILLIMFTAPRRHNELLQPGGR